MRSSVWPRCRPTSSRLLAVLLVVLYGWLEYRHDKRRSGRRYFGEVALLRALPEAERDWYRANMALTRAVGQPVPS